MDATGDMTQFSTLDQQTDPRFFIAYLDAENALTDVKRLKQVIQAQLELGSGVHLLDVGYSTGMLVPDSPWHSWWGTCSTWRLLTRPLIAAGRSGSSCIWSTLSRHWRRWCE